MTPEEQQHYLNQYIPAPPHPTSYPSNAPQPYLHNMQQIPAQYPSQSTSIAYMGQPPPGLAFNGNYGQQLVHPHHVDRSFLSLQQLAPPPPPIYHYPSYPTSYTNVARSTPVPGHTYYQPQTPHSYAHESNYSHPVPNYHLPSGQPMAMTMPAMSMPTQNFTPPSDFLTSAISCPFPLVNQSTPSTTRLPHAPTISAAPVLPPPSQQPSLSEIHVEKTLTVRALKLNHNKAEALKDFCTITFLGSWTSSN